MDPYSRCKKEPRHFNRGWPCAYRDTKIFKYSLAGANSDEVIEAEKKVKIYEIN